jgi:hypothetical protein
MSLEDKKNKILAATQKNAITLITKEYGRGIDFICRDKELNESGGVHVLQTFFSDDISEETQIQGRTRRQGRAGTYSIVLLDTNLQKFDMPPQEIAKLNDPLAVNKYTVINKFRAESFVKKFPERFKFIKMIRNEHLQSQFFLEQVYKQDWNQVKKFLMKRNEARGGVTGVVSRTIILMDATGSMSDVLDACKVTVRNMLNRAHDILKQHKVASSFEVQFVVYRNYSSRAEAILQYSGWESDPENIWKFMKPIKTSGGQGNEAIEIGLWHVNQQSKTKKVTQVILIGDFPPNTDAEVASRRDHAGDAAYWNKTPYIKPTHYINELQILIKNKIPVHSFYVEFDKKFPAAAAFIEIAELTNGKHGELKINEPNGAEVLTQVVTERVLVDVAEGSGDATLAIDLIASYRKLYDQGHIA